MLLTLVTLTALAAPPPQQLGCPKKALPVYTREKPETTTYPPLMILVSFSMPLESLKALSRSLQPLKGKLVFPGLYKNSFQQTSQKMQDLGTEALIDPTLFRQLNIKKVPVFLLNTSQNPEDFQGHHLSGHITVQGALEIFARQNVSEAKALLNILEKKR